MQTPNTNQPPEQQGYQLTNQPQNQQGYQPYPQQNPQGYPGYPPQNQQFYQNNPQQPVQGYPGYLQPIPQEAPKKKHSKAWIAIPVTLAVLALGYFGVRWVLDNRIVPVAKPVVDPDNSGKQTVTETTGENRDEPPIEQEARTISLPVNPALPSDVATAFETLSDLTESFTPEGDGYVYKDEDTEVTLTVVPPETVEKEVGPVSAKTEEKAAPSVVTGKSGNTAYTAVTTPEKTVVYVTAGDQTVRAETKNEKKEPTKTIQKTASTAVAAMSTTLVKEEPYAKGRDDYDHNHAVYFMEAADCLIFYPAQLTQKRCYEDQSVVFSDSRSSATCSVKLENNPYRNIEELESLMRNSPNNTVLSWGKDWLTGETIQNGTITYTYVGFGQKYMVTAQFSYPRKYSFVFDDLRELIRCRFIEGAKWKSESRSPRSRRASDFDASAMGIADLYYPNHDLWLALPDTLDEQEDSADCIVFYDEKNKESARVTFAAVRDGEADNLFDVFDVVAEDRDVMVGEDYIRWRNRNGMYIGTVCGNRAALLEFTGNQSYYTYKALYDDIICHFVLRYEEERPVPNGNPKPEPANEIVNIIINIIEEKRKEEEPVVKNDPERGNDPLIYHTEADQFAVGLRLYVTSFRPVCPPRNHYYCPDLQRLCRGNGFFVRNRIHCLRSERSAHRCDLRKPGRV